MVNAYFRDSVSPEDNITDEKNLLEDLIDESIEIYGMNCYYLPRESFDEGDMVLGELSKSKFSKAFMVTLFVNSTDKFDGQGDFFSKFGLEIRDIATFSVSRRSFREIIPNQIRQRPREGDLLYIPVMHRMFEVKFVEEEHFHFALNKMWPYIYELRCELFRSSHEPIQTNVAVVDEVGIENSYTIQLNLSSGAGTYAFQETVYQSSNNNINGASSSGQVRTWNAANNMLYVYNIIGEFQPGQMLFGQMSGALYIVQSVDSTTDFSYYDLFDNQDVETQAGEVMDQVEINPLGSM